eukprot:s3966_g2.t2
MILVDYHRDDGRDDADADADADADTDVGDGDGPVMVTMLIIVMLLLMMITTAMTKTTTIKMVSWLLVMMTMTATKLLGTSLICMDCTGCADLGSRAAFRCPIVWTIHQAPYWVEVSRPHDQDLVQGARATGWIEPSMTVEYRCEEEYLYQCSSILLWWGIRHATGHAVVGPGGQVHLEEGRASLKPWIRREHEEAALELDAHGDAQQAPKAVFGEPKVSPTIAKAILSAEAHQVDTWTNLQSALQSQQASASTASSLLLIAEFTFFLMMLYLLNSQDVNVKRLAWSTLQSAVAIFISMLLFMSTKSAWILIAGASYDGAAGVALTWTRYVVVWIVGPVVLLRRGLDDESREAWCSVVSWFTAFCAADAFGELLMLDPFKSSAGANFGGVVLCTFIIWLQCFGACWARHFVVLAASEEASDGPSPREQKQKWADAWQVAETTYAGYVMGLALSMWVRYVISGLPSQTYGRATGYSGSETGWLFLWTMLSVFFGFIIIGVVHRFGAADRSWTARRFSQMTTSIMAMFCAWMALFSLEWQFLFYTAQSGFGGQSADINSAILLAIFSSVFMFFVMRVIDFIADKSGSAAIRSTSIFCELLIGLTWQRVFFLAIQFSGRQYQQSERYIDVMWMWGTAAISGPAWFHFILPRFLQARKDEELLLGLLGFFGLLGLGGRAAEGSATEAASDAKEAPAPAASPAAPPAAPAPAPAKDAEEEEF